ncbi:MAG TPA: zf-HC2 domain-containing protein [Caulobacteraceae bacterium]|jgi:hypothetical protein|nr:zf-HC2 domain-containing protein [Caulobacteraceae bacterium]
MTGRVIPLPGDRHRQIQSLLPWYVAGRLDEDEAAEVEAHLSQCPDCQAELNADRWLAIEVADAPSETIAASLDVDQGWRRIQRQIDREARSGVPGAGLAADWLAGRWKAARQWETAAPWLRWALIGQFCLLLTLGGLLWQASFPAAYRTLGAAPESRAGNIVVVFRPEIKESDFRSILKANHARLVDGPTAADAYVIRVPVTERGKALARLRRLAQVVLAEPLDAEAGG